MVNVGQDAGPASKVGQEAPCLIRIGYLPYYHNYRVLGLWRPRWFIHIRYEPDHGNRIRFGLARQRASYLSGA